MADLSTHRGCRIYLSRAVIGVSASVLATIVIPAGATDYSAGGDMRLSGSYDNNLQLSEKRQSAAGETASGTFALRATTEQTTANLDSQLWFRRYNISDYNSDDQEFRGGITHSAEHSTYGLQVRATRDSTLNSELLDSGRTFTAQRHEQYSATPSWSYQLGEKDLVSLQGSYAISQYHGSGYTDYDYWQSSLLWTHNLSERLRGFAQLTYSDYQSAPLPSFYGQSYSTSSRDKGIQLGGDYAFSENLTASILAGATRNRTNVQVKDPANFCGYAAFLAEIGFTISAPLCGLSDSTSTVSTLDANATWNGLRSDLKLDISRSTQPSSNGYIQQSQQLNLDWRYHIWEYGTVGLSVTAGTTDVPNSKTTNTTTAARDFEYATLSYTHSLNEHWLIDCNYQYRTQKYDKLDRVESNVASLGITWQPDKRHWSR